MIASLGSLFDWIGLFSSIALALFAFFYKYSSVNKPLTKKKKENQGDILNYLVWVPFIASLLASIVLMTAFINRHFELDYVFRYSSTDLPLFYTVTAFWAGQEGSLLMWILLLSIFAVIFWYVERRRSYAAKTLGVVAVTEAFFFLVLCIPANPFKFHERYIAFGMIPQEGLGLNPLLQNLGMVFHPPAVFFAYALFTFPFAIAIGVLWEKAFSDNWLTSFRYWTLFAWLFIGIGNVLGALWAYVELGWGGFWAWDPVENASLLPWITGTAALHSATMYEKRKTLKIWTFMLSFITFFLCILGTYITRSGTIASVHAFEQSPIAGYFLVALVLILILPVMLLASRNRDIEANDISNYASREGTYAISNWLFSVFTLVVLWGTMLPLFTSIFTGKTGNVENQGLSVAREFFDSWTTPVMIGIAILIVLCPNFSYGKVDWGRLMRLLTVPFVLAAVVVAITIGFWGESIIGTITGVIGLTGIFATLWLLYSGLRPSIQSDSWRENLLKNLSAGRRKYGGYLAHIGALLIFLGVFGATIYKVETNLELRQGDTGSFRDVELLYEEPVYLKGPNYEQYGVKVLLKKNGITTGELVPSFAFYPISNQQTYEVAINWGIFRDVYLSLKELKQDGTATISVTLSPLTMFIWVGSIILFLGSVFAMWPRRMATEQLE